MLSIEEAVSEQELSILNSTAKIAPNSGDIRNRRFSILQREL